MATDGQKIVDFLKNLQRQLEATIKLYSKEKSLNDEWEAGYAIKKEGGWVIIRGGCTHNDQREIVENDDEDKVIV